MFPVSWRLRGCSLIFVSFVLFVLMSRTSAKDAWERPGCHKVGKNASVFARIREFYRTFQFILWGQTELTLKNFAKSWLFLYAGLQYHNLGKLINVLQTKLILCRLLPYGSLQKGCAVAQLVKALRGFDCRYGDSNISLTQSFRHRYNLWVNSASIISEYQEYILGEKAAGA